MHIIGKIDNIFSRIGDCITQSCTHPAITTFRPYIFSHHSDKHVRIAIQLKIDIMR